MIITGGVERFHERKSLDQTQVYDCKAQVWKILPGKMNTGRAWHASALLHRNSLVIAGGGRILHTTHKCSSPEQFTTQ